MATLLNGFGADAVVVTRTRDGTTRLTVRAPRSSVLAGLTWVKSWRTVRSLGGEGGGRAAGWSGEAIPSLLKQLADAVAAPQETR